MKKTSNLWNYLLFGFSILTISGILVQKVCANELWALPEKEIIEETGPEILPEEVIPEIVPPEEKVYTFTNCEPSYFDDALFIGDSRTVGLKEYGMLTGADYFADVGMSLYKLDNVKAIIDEQEMTLDELLAAKDYGKIYLMIGINELGYDFNVNVQKYNSLVEKLKNSEPEAVIYLCANMHVTKERSDSEELFNNTNIDRFNAEVKKMTDAKEFFYLDVNEVFDDAEGHLDEQYTVDDAHVLGKYYITWCEWLMTKAIIK